MSKFNIMRRATVGTAIVAIVAASLAGTVSAPAMAQGGTGHYRPTNQVLLSVGEGEVISLPRNVVDVWVSNPGVADVNVTSPRKLGLFGKEAGEATVIATAADGSVVYGANVRVSQNISSMDEMLRAAMPDSKITVTHVGQIAVINGTVASPADAAQAEQLVRMMLNPGIDTNTPGAALKIIPVNRLKTATPLQVMLQVKIAEVSRSLARQIGVNLATSDPTGGSVLGGLSRGRDLGDINAGFLGVEGQTTIAGLARNVLGLDVAGTLDLNENNGLITTLAEPTLVALSGETASFLAGGEFPIPTSNGINGTAIEFKPYGVSLAFTPTVLEGGRISMRVRPEVSELSSAGSIKVSGFEVPSLTTRRTETTVELGSGQSFMIGGLLSNGGNNSIERTPFLGNLPIIGALFRSNTFRRNESELVIIVTPYLVNPVTASQIALPTDGYRGANTAERVFLGTAEYGRSGARRPMPTMAPPRSASPGMGGTAALPSRPAPAQLPAPQQRADKPAAVRTEQASATPGFSF
ncbi:MAG TPA: type II and III secretion system protein family protein [Allosphingosinicella sp.]|jgi:pilus assembly protein CpaC